MWGPNTGKDFMPRESSSSNMMAVQQRALIYLKPLEKKKKKIKQQKRVTLGQEPSGVFFVVVLFILPLAQGPETESLDAVQVY